MMNVEKPAIDISLVVPCFNEEEVLPETAKRLAEKVESLCVARIISENSKIVFVDDGSTDATWQLIASFHTNNPNRFAGIKLAKNRGHQNALLCG
ncbi:MAG: glycosyltransferase, partial [Treponema sp.]|nr:glycosyltransferase [Treponema sp.]